MERNEIIEILKGVVHPEYGQNLVELNMIENIIITESGISFTIALRKSNDPFAMKLKRHSVDIVGNEFPEMKNNITVILKEPEPKKTAKKQLVKPEEHKTIKNIIAVSSCKGGVGKSTVTANLAATLAQSGYSVGILDADIYGPSIPKMFGVMDYVPGSTGDEKNALIIPAERFGVKIQSIGFFIKPNDALVWRGPMATNTLKQLIHQTQWGELDFLLIDLPPGTGDIHLTVISELKIDAAVIVSTPQQLAIADVVRGIEMLRSPHVNIKILGLIENMSWFTPKELPDNKYYIFGQDGCKKLSQECGLPLLAQIPLVAGANENVDNGTIEVLNNNTMYKYFYDMSQKILELL